MLKSWEINYQKYKPGECHLTLAAAGGEKQQINGSGILVLWKS